MKNAKSRKVKQTVKPDRMAKARAAKAAKAALKKGPPVLLTGKTGPVRLPSGLGGYPPVGYTPKFDHKKQDSFKESQKRVDAEDKERDKLLSMAEFEPFLAKLEELNLVKNLVLCDMWLLMDEKLRKMRTGL